MVMTGYWHAEQETEHAIRDGWLHTGDVGRLDSDGYLYIVDRIKDLIIRGGYNVYPRDVEDVLLGHPAVLAAAVVGRPDEKYGEEVVAFVQLREGSAAEPAELVEFARARLSAVKYPREVRIVDQVPLTSVMKTTASACGPPSPADAPASRDFRRDWLRRTVRPGSASGSWPGSASAVRAGMPACRDPPSPGPGARTSRRAAARPVPRSRTWPRRSRRRR